MELRKPQGRDYTSIRSTGMRPSVEFRNASAISDFPPHTVGIREQVADVRQIPKNGERHLFESEVETINTSELTP